MFVVAKYSETKVNDPSEMHLPVVFLDRLDK